MAPRVQMARRMGFIAGMTLGFASLLVPACLAGDTGSKDFSKSAEASIKVSDNSAIAKIKTIVMPARPVASDGHAKNALYEAVCSNITKRGFKPVPFKVNWKEEGAKLTLNILTCNRGQSLAGWARQMLPGGRGGGSTENYSLKVSVRITVKDGENSKIVYDASCSMWHQFRARPVDGKPVGGTTVQVPVDHAGCGPNNLDEAIEQIGEALVGGLPESSSQ